MKKKTTRETLPGGGTGSRVKVVGTYVVGPEAVEAEVLVGKVVETKVVEPEVAGARVVEPEVAGA